jgi:multiple sugar transport system ATP-binding protein
VAEAAKILDLEEYLERKPKALSGGQRQRVAMGRAIVREPQVFLMDEPLSNLDAKLRVQTRTQITALQHRLGVTTVYVTHDQVEAMTMGDRVAVLKDGLLQQADTPINLYDRPTNVFVAGFIGSPAMNLLELPLTGEGADLAGYTIPLPRTATEALARDGVDRVTVGFRPESVELVGEGEGFPMQVDVVEELGSDAYAYGRLGQARSDELRATEERTIVRVDPRKPPAQGHTAYLRIQPGELHLFSPVTGNRIGD